MCSFPNCKKKDFKDGLCSDHYRAQANASNSNAPAPVYGVCLARTIGEGGAGQHPNSDFLNLASSETPAQPYYQRILALQSEGPTTRGEEFVHGVPCCHDTQKSNNVTVWYSWRDNTMTVWGLGSHKGGDGKGNDSYAMLWFDGKNKTWNRDKGKKKKNELDEKVKEKDAKKK